MIVLTDPHLRARMLQSIKMSMDYTFGPLSFMNPVDLLSRADDGEKKSPCETANPIEISRGMISLLLSPGVASKTGGCSCRH